MVGFLFGFSGRVAPDNKAALGPEWEHCSHLLGVLPEWRGQGLGYRLKLAQRDWALRRGFELVTWTYDPLQSANAALNLGKLGAVCRCYLRDFYGELADEINAGLPSDRFEVAWWVGSTRVRDRVERGWQSPALADLLAQGAVILNPGRPTAEGWAEPGPVGLPAGPWVLVEFPAHIQDLKSHSLPLAQRWQLCVRQACEMAFAGGYTAVDVVRANVDDIDRTCYLLTREG
jgi:predicted GNAT superfamily acetyltransferase